MLSKFDFGKQEIFVLSFSQEVQLIWLVIMGLV